MVSNKLKIVHINTFPAGGAGVAAMRLHEALLKNVDIESTFVCMSDEPLKLKNTICIPFKKATIWEKIVNKLFKPVMAEQLKERLVNKYHPRCEFLGLPYSDYSIEKIQQVMDADIINLHWISGFINYPTFFKEIQKPIVWTIHDLSPFMGCFSYPIEEKNNPEMAKINSAFYKEKINALKGYKHQIYVIGPSKWIMEEAKKYQPFSPLKYYHIPNGIDSNQLDYINTEKARRELGLSQDVCILLFVCEHVENKRKRFDRILNLVEKLSNDKIIFIAVGNKSNVYLNNRIHFTGKITSLEKLNLYYASADYFLMPSQEDNFPNVVLESLFCGTPVISNNVGGMKDIINSTNGFLIDDFDVETIAQLINNRLCSADFFNRQEISTLIKEKYDIKQMVNEYIKIYGQCV